MKIKSFHYNGEVFKNGDEVLATMGSLGQQNGRIEFNEDECLRGSTIYFLIRGTDGKGTNNWSCQIKTDGTPITRDFPKDLTQSRGLRAFPGEGSIFSMSDLERSELLTRLRVLGYTNKSSASIVTNNIAWYSSKHWTYIVSRSDTKRLNFSDLFNASKIHELWR